MNKFFTLLSAMLLWQSVVVAQNVLRITSNDTTRVVRLADLDSVTIRAKYFYGEPVGVGTYEFSIITTAVRTTSVYKSRVGNGTSLWQYKLDDWLFVGKSLTIDYNTSTGRCYVQPQPTGYTYGQYGMVMVCDGATYTGDESNVSTFDEETGVFKLYMVYYVDAGTLGYGYEYLRLGEQNAAPALRNRKLQSPDLTITGTSLVPVMENAPVMQQREANHQVIETNDRGSQIQLIDLRE
jgi:hypothetical protein